MRYKLFSIIPALAGLTVFLAALARSVATQAIEQGNVKSKTMSVARAQVPSWSEEDFNFFMHGSMSTEIIPENILRAFIGAYPDLFPKEDLSNLGLIPDREFGWPLGFSRANVQHFGGLSS